MKTMQKLFAIAILALAAISMQAQIQQPGSGPLQETSGVPWQIAGVWTFNASSPPTGGFNVLGLKYFQLVFVPSGTVSTCAISLDSSTNSGSSFTTGGIESAATIGSCASATAYANSSASSPTLTGQLTPTITGTGSVTVTMFGYINNPGAAGSSSTTVISPVDGSGYVEMNCKAGCTGGNANGQATMANSAPVVIASNQSALPANVTQVNSVALGSPSNYGTSPGAVSVLGVNAFVTNAVAVTGTFWQTTQPVSGTFWQTTQPVSGTVTTTPPANASSNITQLNSVALGSPSNYGTSPGAVSVAGVNAFVTNSVALSLPAAILAGQQAVTASAVALATNTLTKGLCVEALSTNTISVYVGPTGVTTATGIELPAKAVYCPAVSNSNALFVIATTTGASVTWSGN